jgi:hypothetical protein
MVAMRTDQVHLTARAKGRVERNFGTAQDRLVKGMRVAEVNTLEQANQYLSEDYLVWWDRELTVAAASPDDAHRRLDKSHNLAASLSQRGDVPAAARSRLALGWQVIPD